jgi:hypothetical protein
MAPCAMTDKYGTFSGYMVEIGCKSREVTGLGHTGDAFHKKIAWPSLMWAKIS